MEVRLLDEADAVLFWHLRLEALEREPKAFGRSAEDYRHSSPESVAPRLRPIPDGDFTLGAFTGSQLLGLAGLSREVAPKMRHRAQVWGVYVTESARGQGVGRALVSAIIERARSLSGLEQLGITVSLSQSSARKLYASLGFRAWGVEPRALRVGDEYMDEEHLVLYLQTQGSP